MEKLALSVVVIAYNMAREIPRTIRSLSVDMQQNILADDYEILIIDNGSSQPFDEMACLQWGSNISIHHFANPTVSPVPAINYGLSLAKGKLIGVWIDGARLASPNLLSMALNASRMHTKPIVGTISFHLGPDWQHRSILNGYNQAIEDKLLESINWAKNPYALFDISVVAANAEEGWFGSISESNALFLTKEHWDELGGFDVRFEQPGGGLVNLDTWKRAVNSANSQLFVLLGETTFHQIHGGIASNSTGNSLLQSLKQFQDEYERIRGESYTAVAINPIYVGTAHLPALQSIEWSARQVRIPSKPSIFKYICGEVCWFFVKRLRLNNKENQS